MDDSEIDNNIYWCAANPGTAEEQLKALQQAGHDLNSVVADPQFGDVENGDFSLSVDSPARALGIRPIDTATLGLQSPWKEKLVGKNLLQTRITPSTQTIKSGFRVTMECSQPDAVIRYTVAGSEPTEKSTVYKSSLKFSEPVYLRAKAFKGGAADLYGAAEFYTGEGAH